nr:reverse transcriptase domain-containing protein [Tanacetum cinerariifolium]
CLAVDGNTFPELRDNIQGYVSAAVVNYNQGNSVYRPLEQYYQVLTQQNQNVPLNELEKVKRMNEANMKAMQTQINMVKNELRNEMKILIQASLSNQTNEIKNMMASLFQMNTASTSGSGSFPSNTVANPKGELKAITTRSGIVLDGPSVPTPPPFINPEEDKRVEETLTDPDLFEYTIKVPPPPGGNVLPEKFLDIDSTKDLHPPLHVNPLSSSTTFSPSQLLEELTDELSLIMFPPKYNDDLQFDVESDLKEIEFLLHQDIDSSLKDLIDQNKKLAISNASLVLEDFDPPLYEPLFFKEVPSIPGNLKTHAERFCPPSLHFLSFIRESFSVGCQKPGHLAALLGCAEMKVATWDDLAFKLITLGWNVKHENFCKNVDLRLKFEYSTFTLNE